MIEWILTSTVLTALAIAARYALRGRIGLRLQYGLWLLVLARLLIPVSFGGAAVSVANVAGRPAAAADRVVAYVGGEVPDLAISEPDPTLSAAEQKAQYEDNQTLWQAEPAAARARAGTPVLLGDVLLWVWIGGGAALAAVLLASNLRFARALQRSRSRLDAERKKLPVYVTEAAETPCLFGLFRPAIYVTPEAAAHPEALAHTLAHEETHYRHGDHIWAALRCIALVLHWYNPVVWWAAALSRRDGELACDEATIARLGEGQRAAYGRTLIGLTCRKPAALLVTATTMTGGARGLKERIRLLARRPKTTLGLLIVVVLLAAAAVGCTFTGPTDEPDIRLPEEPADPVSDEGGADPSESDGRDELSAVLEQLETGSMHLALLTEAGVIADFDGSSTGNASHYANALATQAYEPEDLDAAGSVEIHVIPAAEEQDWCLTYYDDSDVVTLTMGENRWKFRAGADVGYLHAGDLARQWYDEAEFEAIGGGYDNQDAIVIPDEGQDYLTAAQAFCQTLEERHLAVSGGSSFKYTFVQCTVSAAEDTTAAFRERGEIGEDTWAFTLTTVFVPKNEEALHRSMAGNTGAYDGGDPAVPEGAYEYFRCGFITREDGGWRGELTGTGW